MTALYLSDIPAGRTADSYRYRIDALHGGVSIGDDLVTDNRDEAFRILGATLEQGYTARFRSGVETRLFDEVNEATAGTERAAWAERRAKGDTPAT